MSQLEGRVKPIVEALLGSGSVFMDSRQQAILGTWAVKNAMIFEALRLDPPWFYLVAERKIFKETLQLPVQTFIWIAKCVEHNGFYCSLHDLTGIADESTNPISSCLTTMAFGALAIQVLSVRSQEAIAQHSQVISKLQSRSELWDQVALYIWPIQQTQISWPPANGLFGEVGLQAFSERWKSGQTV
jgi:hypothetical protein